MGVTDCPVCHQTWEGLSYQTLPIPYKHFDVINIHFVVFSNCPNCLCRAKFILINELLISWT